MYIPALWALAGTGFTFMMTVLGSALVFFFCKESQGKVQKVFLGFAAGVMIAASVWSLLIPAVEMAEEMGASGWLPAAGGLILGAGFMILVDIVVSYLKSRNSCSSGETQGLKSTTMLMLAVTLHNIPEGMAVGLAFALAGQTQAEAGLAAAAVLALGIGIQNFPEGAAISLPMREAGASPLKAFLYGGASGIVEPLFGVITVFLVGGIAPFIPWFLSFAAGAMIYVVVEELIPCARLGERSSIGTISVMTGFIIMMVLDIALG